MRGRCRGLPVLLLRVHRKRPASADLIIAAHPSKILQLTEKPLAQEELRVFCYYSPSDRTHSAIAGMFSSSTSPGGIVPLPFAMTSSISSCVISVATNDGPIPPSKLPPWQEIQLSCALAS